MNRLLLSTTLAGLGVLPVAAQDSKPAPQPAEPAVLVAPQTPPVAPAASSPQNVEKVLGTLEWSRTGETAAPTAPVPLTPPVARVAPIARVAPVAPVSKISPEGFVLGVKPAMAPGGLSLVTTASSPLDDETESLRKRVADLEKQLEALLDAQESPKATRHWIKETKPSTGSGKANSGLFKVRLEGEHEHEDVEIHELDGNVFQWVTSDGDDSHTRRFVVNSGTGPAVVKEIEVKHVGDPKFFVGVGVNEDEEGESEHQEGVRRWLSVSTDSEDFNFDGFKLEDIDLDEFGLSEINLEDVESHLGEMGISFENFEELDNEELEEYLEDLDIDLEEMNIDLEDLQIEGMNIDFQKLFDGGEVTVRSNGRARAPRVQVSGTRRVGIGPRAIRTPRATRRFSRRADRDEDDSRFPTRGLFFGGNHDHEEKDEDNLHEEFADLLEEMHDELREMREVMDELHDELRELAHSNRKSMR